MTLLTQSSTARTKTLKIRVKLTWERGGRIVSRFKQKIPERAWRTTPDGARRN